MFDYFIDLLVPIKLAAVDETTTTTTKTMRANTGELCGSRLNFLNEFFFTIREDGRTLGAKIRLPATYLQLRLTGNHKQG